jgi:hypothetical protein
MLDATRKQRVVEHGKFLLERFHAANEKNPDGLEAASWRGRLGGFRAAIDILEGRRATSELMEILRQHAPIPHVGPVYDDGSIVGTDMEAHLGL